jgi:hypothetical protein
MHMEFVPLLLSVVSLLLSVTVAWLTLFRRGKLGMTQPMLIGFLYENEQPKVFFRTILFATGKRGYIIEALYIKVRNGESTQTFNFWMYGETKELKIGSGLRVGDDGVSSNHHFLPPKDAPTFAFLAGEYTIDAYARILNRNAPMLLSTVKLTLSHDLAAALNDRTMLSDHTMGVLFTWRPDSQHYRGEVSAPVATEGRSRSVSGAGRGKLPWA